VAADIYIKQESRADALPEESVQLHADACYWFLYRYFEAANLDRSHELIGLYEDADISGYQFQRLEDELLLAREDAAARPETWTVLVGWDGEVQSRDTEIHKEVKRAELLGLIDRLLGLVRRALERGQTLVVVGD